MPARRPASAALYAASRIAPDRGGQPGGQVKRGAGVVDRGLDLGPVAHDPGVSEQPRHVVWRRTRRPRPDRTRRTRHGNSPASAGWSARTGPTETPRGTAARRCRCRRGPAGPTPGRDSRGTRRLPRDHGQRGWPSGPAGGAPHCLRRRLASSRAWSSTAPRRSAASPGACRRPAGRCVRRHPGPAPPSPLARSLSRAATFLAQPGDLGVLLGEQAGHGAAAPRPSPAPDSRTARAAGAASPRQRPS